MNEHLEICELEVYEGEAFNLVSRRIFRIVLYVSIKTIKEKL